MAAAILLVVAVVSAGGGPRPGAADAGTRALQAWGRSGTPVITSLIDDLRTVELDTADPATTRAPSLGRDEARVGADLVTAQRLATPPGLTVAAVWHQTLAQLAAGEETLRAAAVTIDPAAVALAHQQFAGAGDGLLQLGELFTGR